MITDGFKIFTAGVWRMPLLVKAWLAILMTINGILPFLFLNELAAQVTLFAMMAGGIIGCAMSDITGFNRYLGLMHGPWIPMAYVHCHALFQRSDLDPNFKMWLVASLTVTCVSLIIDALDVAKYKREQLSQQ